VARAIYGLTKRTWEQQREAGSLTEWRLVDVDVDRRRSTVGRRCSLRMTRSGSVKASGSSMARREEDGEVGEASGSQGRSSGRFMTSRWCSGCGFGRRWTVAGEFTGEELSGERRQWRWGFLALGGNGEEGVDAARESGNGVAVLHALLGGRA